MRDRVSASVVSEYRSETACRPLPFQTPQDVLCSATVIQTANVQNDRISLACQPFQLSNGHARNVQKQAVNKAQQSLRFKPFRFPRFGFKISAWCALSESEICLFSPAHLRIGRAVRKDNRPRPKWVILEVKSSSVGLLMRQRMASSILKFC